MPSPARPAPCSQARGSQTRVLAIRHRRRPGRRDAGALILSYVIIVPVFMLAIMVIIQGALWYLAREAALAFARNDASGYLLGPSATDRGSTPTTIRITVSGHVPTFVPGLPINISQVVQAPVEKFIAPSGP